MTVSIGRTALRFYERLEETNLGIRLGSSSQFVQIEIEVLHVPQSPFPQDPWLC